MDSIRAEDIPAPSSSTSTIGPIIGVVDGTDAAPGEVGEFLTANGTFNYAAGTDGFGTTSTGHITLINMPPGDWDMTIFAMFSTLITSALFLLDPYPVTGVSNKMFGLNGNFTGGVTGGITTTIVGPSARGSFAVNTTLVFEVQVYQLGATLPAGVMNLHFEARRRR